MYIHVPVRHALGATVGPFEGAFVGTLSGDQRSTATVTAVLTQPDTRVAGKIQLSSGLLLDFPTIGRPLPDVCAIEPVDLREFVVTGAVSPTNPRHADVSGEADEPTDQFPLLLKSMKVRISIAGDLSADGNTLSASVTLKPSKCGARTIPVTLTRQS